jgi:hypothetical protein
MSDETYHRHRHDDLENPPDFVTLRDDYWRLYDIHRELLRQIRGFCLVHDADCDACPCCEAVEQRRLLDAAMEREGRLREAYGNLMGQIEAMRDRAVTYAEESGAEGDTDKAMENMRVFCVLKELHRLGRGFMDAAIKTDGSESL